MVLPTSKMQLALQLPGTTSGAHMAKQGVAQVAQMLLSSLSRAAYSEATSVPLDV